MKKCATHSVRKDRNCPLCSCEQSAEVCTVRDHFSLTPFRVHQCVQCEVSFIKDPPPLEAIASYYENCAGETMRQGGSSLFDFLRGKLILRELSPLLSKIPVGSRILDFGAGDGQVSSILKRSGYEVQALDMYPENRWSQAGVRYRQLDLNRVGASTAALDFPAGKLGETKADAVILRHVLEHLWEPTEVIKRFYEAQIQYVLLIVPNHQSRLRARMGESWAYWDPPRHLVYFDQSSLNELADRSGYKMLETKTYGIDELVVSAYRKYFLSQPELKKTSKLVEKILNPKSTLTAISAGLASLYGNCVILALFERKNRENAKEQEGG